MAARPARTAAPSSRATAGTGSSCRPTRPREQVAGLREAQARYDRPAELGNLEISITPAGPVTADTLRAYEDAGVDRLIVYAVGAKDEVAVERFLAAQAELVLA